MKNKFLKCTSIILILFISFMIVGFSLPSNDNIPSNVHINNINVGDTTKAQALVTLKKTYEPLIKKSYILLKYNYNLWKINLSEIKFAFNYQKAVDAAYAVPRNDTVPDATTDPININNTTNSSINIDNTTNGSINIKNPRIDIKMSFTYDKKLIENFLNKLSKNIDKEPINAILKISSSKFTIIDGKSGIKLDNSAALKLIVKSINLNKASKITIPTKVVQPKYSKADLLNTKDKLGEYTTYFRASDVGRVKNITLASNNANNMIVMPNEIFSLNKTIGPRLEKYGFKLAHVIVNGEFVDGLGGGICQVSTTFYNAILYSNLKIIERKNHSIPSAYVKLGRDATVSGDSIDFKFQNNSKYPIFIYNEVIGNHITFKIYGKNDYPNRKVKITTKILSVTKPTIKTIMDPTLRKGSIIKDRKSYSGYVVDSFRQVFQNGKLLYIEKLPISKYPVINGISRVGTKI